MARVKYIICDNICSKGDDGYAEAGEEIAKHGAIGENRVLPPGFSLGPWVPEKWEIGHSCEDG